MKRRDIRQHIFRMLYLKNFHSKNDVEEQIEMYFENWDFSQLEIEDQEYLTQRFNLIINEIDSIDKVLEDIATGWKLNRMSKVDLAILRIAVYEIKFDDMVPSKVAINEAVEIAKEYGGENSPSFINGVLAKLM